MECGSSRLLSSGSLSLPLRDLPPSTALSIVVLPGSTIRAPILSLARSVTVLTSTSISSRDEPCDLSSASWGFRLQSAICSRNCLISSWNMMIRAMKITAKNVWSTEVVRTRLNWRARR